LVFCSLGKWPATMFTSPSLEIRNASLADNHWHRTLAVGVNHERVKHQISNSPCQIVRVAGSVKSEQSI
jgi:hypothetical protein